jgi:Na+/melibiose symporter-like transporter
MVQAYTDDLSERALMSSRKAIFQTLANLAFSLIAMAILMNLTKGAPQGAHYTIFTACIASVMVICYFVLFALSKPYESDTRSLKAEEGGGERISTGKAVATVVVNDQLWIVMVTLFGLFFAMMTTLGVLIFLFDGVYHEINGMPIYGTVTALAGLPGAYLGPVLAKRLGKKNTFLVGVFGNAACLLITYFFLMGSFITFIVGVTVAGFFLQLAMGLSFACFADCVTYSVWKRGVAAAEFTMGMYSLPIKVAVMGSRIVIPVVLGAAGHATDDSGHVVEVASALSAYQILAVLIPAAVVAVVGVVFVLLFRLTDKRLGEMNEDLASGNAPFMKAAAAA